MGFSLKDIFKKDEETLVVDRRNQAIKWLIMFSVVLILMIIIVVFLKSLNNKDENRRVAITRDIRAMQHYIENIKNEALRSDNVADFEYPGYPLESGDGAEAITLNGEEYRYGYYVLYPENYKDIASTLNLSNEYYIVNYDTLDVVNYAGIKYKKEMYYTIDDLIAIDEGRLKEIPSKNTIIIRKADDMKYLAQYPYANFKLAGNIDMTPYSTGAGWEPVANFSGKFNGRGYTISNLTIQRPTEAYVGLFKEVTDKGSVQNVIFENVNVTGENYTGVVAGTMNGSVRNVVITSGNVIAGNGSEVGGLVGSHQIGTISNCRVTLNKISGRNNVGGAIGIYNSGTVEKVIVDCASISALEFVGGFAGSAVATSTSYMNECGTSVGSISARSSIGGLIGKVEMMSDNQLNISNCYAKGTISGGEQNMGGLVGYIYTTTGTKLNLINSYATVNLLNKIATSGGCVGLSNIITGSEIKISEVFWEKNLVVGEVLNGVGAVTTGTFQINFTDKTPAEMRYRSTFANWDLVKVWGLDERVNTPYLRFEKNI